MILVQLETLVPQVPPDQLDLLVHWEIPVDLVHKVLRDLWVQLDQRVLLDHQDQKDQLAVTVLRDKEVFRVLLVYLVTLELLVHSDHSVHQDHLGCLDCKEKPVVPDSLDHLVLKDPEVHLELQVPSDLRDRLVH